ncbi:CvpA family protein [Desulfothermobacter acidiphilus]|uniref:CvpA family protein n=1 Tax=Desulfothermobacter acidiphilus TaxID=1938353 RepID=UPI003F8BBEF8
MNWFDVLLLLVIVVSAWSGWRRGLILGLLRLAALVIGYMAATRYTAPLAEFLDRNWHCSAKLAQLLLPYLAKNLGPAVAEVMAHQLAAMLLGGICFLALLLLAARVFLFTATVFTSLVRPLAFPLIDRLAGLGLGLLVGFLFSAVLFLLAQKVAAVSLPPGTPNPLAPLLATSRLAPYFKEFWQLAKVLAPALRREDQLLW